MRTGFPGLELFRSEIDVARVLIGGFGWGESEVGSEFGAGLNAGTMPGGEIQDSMIGGDNGPVCSAFGKPTDRGP